MKLFLFYLILKENFNFFYNFLILFLQIMDYLEKENEIIELLEDLKIKIQNKKNDFNELKNLLEIIYYEIDYLEL